MGGYQVSGQGPVDDGYDEEGYDESQRAEILEATRDGPSDGTLITDLDPDLGDDPDDEIEMAEDEVGEEDDESDSSDDDADEDEVQDSLDEDEVDEDELSDADSAALKP